MTKYNSSGSKIWTKQWGTAFADEGNDVAVDKDGNIYVTGSTFGNLDGNVNVGNWDVFLTKYDSSGNKRWTKQWGSALTDEGSGVAVDKDGNIYVVGTTFGSIDGNISSGGSDIFLTKYTSNGSKVWTKQCGSPSNDRSCGISIDEDGNIYVIGTTFGNIGGSVNAGGSDVFLIKYDHKGNKIWTKQYGTASDDKSYGISIDTANNIYNTGATFGNLSGSANVGGFDIFLGKFSSSVVPIVGTVSGKITKFETNSTEETPLANALIEVLQAGLAKASTITDQEGNYSITVATGSYDIRASAANYQTQVKTGYIVTLGETITINFTLIPVAEIPRVGIVAGKITKSDGITPIAGALVEILQCGIVKSSTTTDLDGNYSAIIATGTYDIRTSCPGYIMQTKTGISVLEGQRTTTNFALLSLQQVGTILGKITETDGLTPISGALVEAVRGTTVYGQSIADINGNYSLALLPGTYNIRVSTPGYHSQMKTDVSVVEGKTTVVNFALFAVADLPKIKELKVYCTVFNPSRNENCYISFNLPQTGHVTIKIYDMLGREVRTLYSGMAAEGITPLILWNGKNDNNEEVASGIYIILIKTEGTTLELKEQRKVIVIK